MKRVSAALMLTLALTLSIAGVAMGAAAHSATGSGHFIQDAQRTFSFTAKETGSDYAGKGQGQLVVHEPGVRIHFEVDCLRVEGNTAYMSGPVTKSNVLDSGTPIWFSVIDNGEGAKADPDQSTYLFYFDPEVPQEVVDCTEGEPEDPFEPDGQVVWYDIGGGNIQVR